MKLQLKEIINSTEQIKSLLEVKLPIKVSYRLMRLIDKLQPELKIYDDKRNELVKEFGTKQENGDMKVEDPKKLEEFSKKMVELWDVEVDVDFDKLKIDEMGDVNIAPKDLVSFIFE